jgi:hypothetical protein
MTLNAIAVRAQHAASLLRPFDVSSEGRRSKERHRRASLAAIASVTAKAVSGGTPLVSAPLTLPANFVCLPRLTALVR